MKILNRKLKRLASRRRGVVSIEYAVIGVVVVVAAAAAFTLIDWSAAITALNAAMHPNP